MFCSKCGSALGPSSSFCSVCGSPAPMGLTTVVVRRPGVITLLAVLHFIGGGLMVIVGTLLMLGVLADPADRTEAGALIILVPTFMIAVAAYHVATGIGLLRLRPYGRTLQIIGSIIGLLGIPIGTIISIAILIYLNKPGIKALFSGRKPDEMTPQELRDIAAVSSGGAGVIIIVLVVIIGMVSVLGIVAAIAIPALLRARIAANEASAVGTLRTIVSAEFAYATSNGGYYDSIRCLARPASCLSGYAGSPFLYDEFEVRSGYAFHLNGTPAPAERAAATSKSSLESFVVIATPVTPGTTGLRVFCVDQTGTVRQTTGDLPTAVPADACPVSWLPLQ